LNIIKTIVLIFLNALNLDYNLVTRKMKYILLIVGLITLAKEASSFGDFDVNCIVYVSSNFKTYFGECTLTSVNFYPFLTKQLESIKAKDKSLSIDYLLRDLFNNSMSFFRENRTSLSNHSRLIKKLDGKFNYFFLNDNFNK
jgi:hypothetical protein